MDVLEAIRTRRSIKQYDSDYVMEEQDFQRLMEHVILSPTSYNIQHWRFVRVVDPLMRKKAREIAWGQQQVEDASELVIFCGQIDAWNDQPERYFRNAQRKPVKC